MKKFFFIFLAVSLFSFFSCNTEVTSSSISLTVLAPDGYSMHGYKPADLLACKTELVRDNGSSFIFTTDISASVSADNLKPGNYVARSYAYDRFGSIIASADTVNIQITDGDSVSKTMKLEWREDGKSEGQICMVRFNSNGGSSVATQRVKAGSTITQPDSPVKANCEFDGWYWNSEKTYPFDFSEQISWNITLHARWIGDPIETSKYIVTFVSYDGSVIDSQIIEEGNYVSEPAVPYREGYSFAGWYYDSDYTMAYSFSTPVTYDLTLYAKWNEIEGGQEDEEGVYTITFIGKDGIVYKTQKVKAGDTPAGFENPSDTEYAFWGWFYDESYSEWFEWGRPVTENLTIFSKWVTTCSVTYYKNDGSDEKYIEEFEKGANIGISNRYAFETNSDGYYFLGWAISPDSTETAYYASEYYGELNENICFYALWTTEYCTLTLVNSYDQSQKSVKTVGKGGKLYIGDLYDWDNQFTGPEGYVTYGYALSADTIQYDGELWSPQNITEDKTYYQLWGCSIEVRTNIYDLYGSEIYDWYTYIYGETITVPDYANQTPWFASNYNFAGWYTDSTCTQALTSTTLDAATQSENGMIHIYASWTEKPHISGITVTLQSVSSDADINLSYDSTSNTFTATGGFASYLWKIDGTKIENAASNTCTIDTSSLDAGIHNLLLAVRDSNGTRYSVQAVIQLQKE